MRHKHKRGERKPTPVAEMGAPPVECKSQQYGQRQQDKQRVAESAVLGKVGDRRAVINDDVQIGKGAENGTDQQG